MFSMQLICLRHDLKVRCIDDINKVCPFARRLLMRSELIFLLISTAYSATLRWNKKVGLAFAGFLRIKDRRLENVHSFSSIHDYS